MLCKDIKIILSYIELILTQTLLDIIIEQYKLMSFHMVEIAVENDVGASAILNL